MKNTSKKIFLFLALAVIALSFAAPVHSGGIADRILGGGAKSLAKQTLDLTRKAADIERKAAELQVKAADIEEKAADLSDRDRRTFWEELARLNVEGPEWLFNDAPGLLANEVGNSTEDIATDDDAGGGIGGLLARVFGGRGGNNSGTASGGSTTAPSGDSSSSGSSSGNTTAPSSDILSGRAGAFFNTFEGKNYHMKTKTIVPGSGMEVIGETFIKGDMMASVSEVMGMTTRSVTRDGMMYVIMDATKTVMVMPIPVSSGNPSEEPVRTTGLIFTGSGTARFDGRNLPYEEYSLSIEEGSAKSQWFLDGNNLAGFRTIVSADGRTETIDMVILELNQNVPNSVFEIPDGYQRMDLPQMPGGY
jgi:hypothetical protein